MATLKDNTASQRIYIRVTPEEKELIKKYANIDKLFTTDYLKKLALKDIFGNYDLLVYNGGRWPLSIKLLKLLLYNHMITAWQDNGKTKCHPFSK